MNFVNKGTLMFFPHSSFILLLQMMAGIVIVQVLRACGQVKLSHGFSRKKLMQLLPLCLLYNMNTGTALMCLSKVSVPVYSTMKRLTPMLVLGTKICTTRQLPHPRILLSVVLVVVGCVIAGYGDLSFDAAGYAFAFMSASFQATYLILVEHTGSEKGIGSAELLLYNSVLSLPFLLIVATATGELGQIGEAYRAAIAASASFPLLLVLCSVMGCLLNYSIFLCTMNNSALTTTIVGVLKGVLSTLLGFFLLGGVKFNWLNVVGICMNTCGGVIYTITKYERRRRRSMSLRGGGGGRGTTIRRPPRWCRRTTRGACEAERKGEGDGGIQSEDSRGTRDGISCCERAAQGPDRG